MIKNSRNIDRKSDVAPYNLIDHIITSLSPGIRR